MANSVRWMREDTTAIFIKEAGYLAFALVCLVAWITHIAWAIKAGAVIFGALGAVLPPIGAIHGIMLWFG